MSEKAQFQFFATCPKGLELLLKQELEALGSSEVRETVAGVYFSGGLAIAYRACLWSRLANRILLPLTNGPVDSAEDLYRVTKAVPWSEHMEQCESLAVEFLGTNSAIRNTQFGAQTIKDAIVDKLRDETGARPNVDRKTPDIRINARLAKNIVDISLDISGESLHRRGYRIGQGGAPLKENLAAALLLRARWPDVLLAQGALLDPMCGSGTFLIEATMMATDMAPGLLRAVPRKALFDEETVTENWQASVRGFGFEKWAKHDATLWQEIVADALQRFAAGKHENIPEIRGYDNNPRVLGSTQKNIHAAGLDDFIRITEKDITEFKKPTHKRLQPGLILCNPPYGERLGEQEALRETYRCLARQVKQEFGGWRLAVFSGNSELAREMRLRLEKKYQFFNGTIPSELLIYDINDTAKLATEPPPKAIDTEAENKPLKERPLGEGAQMVANRLRKNLKKLHKWCAQEAISCYRVYDADMPEYSAVIDVYTSTRQECYLHVQEYAPPKSIDEEDAARRFNELIHACAQVFELDEAMIISKSRRRNRGKQQYEKFSDRGEQRVFNVREAESVFKVNLTEYLDTGLFLDHRPLRDKIASAVRGKQFLNLFCYTATASVRAAMGGAKSTTSVDMSNTYLQWGEENFKLNNIHSKKHQLIQSDCLEWLKQCRQGFDVIMLDPPSFSNSKRMAGVLDVQRDHVVLIKRCMELLLPGGVLYFSNNLRSFKIDEQALAGFSVKDISSQTLSLDFQQNPKIHRCWEIRQ